MRLKHLVPVVLGVLAIALSGCGGTSSLNGILTTPVITAITPNPVTHGQTITITGTSLNGTLTTATFSGNVSATSTASAGSTTSVTVVVPSTISYPATYSVTVTTSDGQGDVSSASNAVTLQVN